MKPIFNKTKITGAAGVAGLSLFKLRVRGKLFAAVGAIVALTAIAIGIGLYSFNTVQRGFDQLAEHSLPSIGNAARLSVTSSDIATAAGAVANSVTAEQQTAAFSALQASVQFLGAIEKKIVHSEANAPIVKILQAETDAFGSGLAELDETTRSVIAAREVKDQRMRELFATYDGVNSVITPIVDDAYFTVVLGGEDAMEQSKQLVNNLAETEMTKLRMYLELRAETNLLAGLTETAAYVDDTALATLFEDKVMATNAKISEIRSQMAAESLTTGADEAFDRLVAMSTKILSRI